MSQIHSFSISTTVHVKICFSKYTAWFRYLKKLQLFENAQCCVGSCLMTLYPIWRVLSSKTPYNTKSEYILRVVGPSGNQPTIATKSR